MTSMRARVVALLCLVVVGVAGIPATTFAQGTPLLGVVRGANTLVQFNSSNPDVILSSLPITGLVEGEVVRAIDTRPSNGLLYGLATPSGLTSQVRLYTINPTTGQATPVGLAASVSTAASFWGMSFNPVVDRLRVVSTTHNNARLNPDTSTLAAIDTPLSLAGFTDAIAYDNQSAGATQTTLFGIDIGTSRLIRIGGPQGTPSANGGATTDIGPLGVTLDGNFPSALDWAPNGTFFAVLRSGGHTGLYTVNSSTGAASLVGVIGNGTLIIDSLAVGNAGLFITPPSGTYTARQRFDMVLLLDAPGRAIVGGSAIFDGINVTGFVASCATLGHTASGLATVRCANFGGPLFGPGHHTFTVNLNLNTGEVISATVNWNVLAASEP